MYEVIGNLKNKIILNEKTILDLKSYIYTKYPDYSSRKLSLVLADAVHKIMSRNIAVFDEVQRYEIERSLVRDAVKGNDFSISAFKVFSMCCQMNLEDEDDIHTLQKWLNSIQDKPVIKDELVGFINILKSYGELPIEDAVNYAAESLNEGKASISVDEVEVEGSVFQECRENIECSSDNIENKATRRRHIHIEFIPYFIHKAADVFKTYGRRGTIITASIIVIFLTIISGKWIGGTLINTLDVFKEQSVSDVSKEEVPLEIIIDEKSNGLPEELQYVEIDKSLLRTWLDKRNSILAEEPYLSSILDAAREYNINPLFMIAITGQEQGFVPKSQENALQIANNPFNVYGSWVKYNSNIIDSSKVAAQTIINLSEGRPDEAHAIQWINQKYAEDKNWWVGVDKIFNQLKKEIINK